MPVAQSALSPGTDCAQRPPTSRGQLTDQLSDWLTDQLTDPAERWRCLWSSACRREGG